MSLRDTCYSFTVNRAASVFHLPRPFLLKFGGRLDAGPLLYETNGSAGAPVLVVLGGISAGRHVASGARDASPGWFEHQAGPGRALDTRKYQILSFDFITPKDGAILTSEDHAVILNLLLDHLGIERVHAIVGASYGGMVALSFCEQFPARAGRLAVLCAAHESHPYASGFRAIQREILAIDRGPRGVALARALGMLTYRSAGEFAARFGPRPSLRDGGLRFESVEYIQSRGAKFAEQFAAEKYASLSLAIDAHGVDPSKITVPAWLFASQSDLLVPPAQMRQLQQLLGGPAELYIHNSDSGHDAFLKDTAAVSHFLQLALAPEVRS